MRDELLLAPDIRYFNAANIGPTFRAVVTAQQRGTMEFHNNPSREFREKYPAMATRLRARLAARLNARPEEIALVRNASEANTVVLRGLDLRAGDRIILTEHNHQSTMDTWRLRAEREGLDLKIVPTPISARSPQEVVDAIAAAITPRTRAIFLSHMTNVTGLVYPVAAISELSRRQGFWLHVDGAQSFGWMKIDLTALGCDSYSGSTHKWLMGPLEGGVLYVRRDRLDDLHPLMLSHGYWLTDSKDLETAQKFEILGQRDDPKLDAINATLDLMDGIGEAAIETRVRALATEMRGILAKVPGARLIGTADPALSGPVIGLAFEGRDVLAMRSRLWREGRVATASAMANNQPLIRFSPHLYNSIDEMHLAAELLARS
ncbi:aminotransferase class V-fold PLP-dependent enzyme [Sphingomonas oleivorans]|uniref:aminotransferase class V-fold PLP-dependent enzyme n=1 Tax=Sphingomonas oleivorans TaxID=1735121 RepID=UPI001FAFDC50|nr:aminotransferase class V-fold PLP-dependent enzyme [Sphingomonas oleivorans]